MGIPHGKKELKHRESRDDILPDLQHLTTCVYSNA
jgi:hypothetical protein